MADKTIGIYKITNPKGRVYVGQSVDVKKRFRNYKSLNCKAQTGLYNSLRKYGAWKHHFEVITECEEEYLNVLERYYQEEYDCVRDGLNCMYVQCGTAKRKPSKDSVDKMRKSLTGFKHSMETRLKMSESQLGRKHTKESRDKISNSKKGVPFSDEHIQSISKLLLNMSTGIFYTGTTDAANSLGVKPKTFRAWMSGQNKNKSNFRYV